MTTTTVPPTDRDLARTRAFLAAVCEHCGWPVEFCPCATRLDEVAYRRWGCDVEARHRAAVARARVGARKRARVAGSQGGAP